MVSQNSEFTKKLRAAVRAKIEEYGLDVDEELPDYVMIMIGNKKSKERMKADLKLFLGNNTSDFVEWLFGFFQKIKVANSLTSTSSLRELPNITSHITPREQIEINSECESPVIQQNYMPVNPHIPPPYSSECKSTAISQNINHKHQNGSYEEDYISSSEVDIDKVQRSSSYHQPSEVCKESADSTYTKKHQQSAQSRSRKSPPAVRSIIVNPAPSRKHSSLKRTSTSPIANSGVQARKHDEFVRPGLVSPPPPVRRDQAEDPQVKRLRRFEPASSRLFQHAIAQAPKQKAINKFMHKQREINEFAPKQKAINELEILTQRLVSDSMFGARHSSTLTKPQESDNEHQRQKRILKRVVCKETDGSNIDDARKETPKHFRTKKARAEFAEEVLLVDTSRNKQTRSFTQAGMSTKGTSLKNPFKPSKLGIDQIRTHLVGKSLKESHKTEKVFAKETEQSKEETKDDTSSQHSDQIDNTDIEKSDSPIQNINGSSTSTPWNGQIDLSESSETSDDEAEIDALITDCRSNVKQHERDKIPPTVVLSQPNLYCEDAEAKITSTSNYDSLLPATYHSNTVTVNQQQQQQTLIVNQTQNLQMSSAMFHRVHQPYPVYRVPSIPFPMPPPYRPMFYPTYKQRQNFSKVFNNVLPSRPSGIISRAPSANKNIVQTSKPVVNPPISLMQLREEYRGKTQQYSQKLEEERILLQEVQQLAHDSTPGTDEKRRSIYAKLKEMGEVKQAIKREVDMLNAKLSLLQKS